MKVSRLNHVDQEYPMVVGSEDLTLDVKICLLGDVDESGDIDSNDPNILLFDIHGAKPITDEYIFTCGDVDMDKNITVNDVSMILAHYAGTELLW